MYSNVVLPWTIMKALFVNRLQSLYLQSMLVIATHHVDSIDSRAIYEAENNLNFDIVHGLDKNFGWNVFSTIGAGT